MKQFFMAAIAGIMLCFTACTGKMEAKTTDSGSNQQKNIAASDAIMKAFQTGDVNAIDSVVSEDFLDHTDRGDIRGRDSLKAMIKVMQASFKDMKTEKIHELADDEYVYSRMRYTGTSDGTMGMPKGPYDMTAMEVSKYKDGKAIEHWGFMEMQAMTKMMAPHDMKTMDSTQKK